MSGSNIFGNSAVSGGFATPLVKTAVAVGVVVVLGAGYVLLSGQANDLFRGGSGPPPAPTPQTAPQTTKFTPMPAVAEERPKINWPGGGNANTNASGGGQRTSANGNTADDRMLGIVSKIDLYSGPSRPSAAAAPRNNEGMPRADQAPKGELEASLTPTRLAATGVEELRHLDYLIEKGRTLPCTQMSFSNSTFAGSVTALTVGVIKGETGDVELVGGGAKLFGTIQHGTVNGVDRQFVLWEELTTPLVYDDLGIPRQFRVHIDSPASDQLGQTGMEGDLNRHLGQKIAAVFGISLVQGAIQNMGTILQHGGNGSNNNSPTLNFQQLGQGAESGANMLMRQFLEIPDVLTRLQGKGCAVELVRDLDLYAAYPKLKSLLAMRRGR